MAAALEALGDPVDPVGVDAAQADFHAVRAVPQQAGHADALDREPLVHDPVRVLRQRLTLLKILVPDGQHSDPVSVVQPHLGGRTRHQLYTGGGTEDEQPAVPGGQVETGLQQLRHHPEGFRGGRGVAEVASVRGDRGVETAGETRVQRNSQEREQLADDQSGGRRIAVDAVHGAEAGIGTVVIDQRVRAAAGPEQIPDRDAVHLAHPPAIGDVHRQQQIKPLLGSERPDIPHLLRVRQSCQVIGHLVDTEDRRMLPKPHQRAVQGQRGADRVPVGGDVAAEGGRVRPEEQLRDAVKILPHRMPPPGKSRAAPGAGPPRCARRRRCSGPRQSAAPGSDG